MDSNNKDNLKNIGLGAGAAGLGGLSSYKVYEFFANSPEGTVRKGLNLGFEQGSRAVGRGAIRAATKNNPFAKTITKTTINTGKTIDKLEGNAARDFGRLSGNGKSPLKGIGALALLLGATTATEELVRKGINKYFGEKQASEEEDLIKRNEPDVPIVERVFEDKDGEQAKRAKEDLINEILEKAALSDYGKRMLVHGVIKPGIGTLGFIGSVAALNKIIEGHQKAKEEFDYVGSKFKGRKDIPVEDTIIPIEPAIPKDPASLKLADIVADEIMKLAVEQGIIDKEAGFGASAESLANKIRDKVAKNPTLKKFDDLLLTPKNAPDHVEDTAHMVTEELPREVIRRMVYLSPFAMFGYQANFGRGKNSKNMDSNTAAKYDINA